MTNIWRLHTKTNGENIAEYCIENKVIALGWSLCDSHIEEHVKKNSIMNKEEIIKKRNNIKTFADYKKIIDDYKIYGDKVNDNIKRLANNINKNDLIWLKNNGIFYLGRVAEESSYSFKIDVFTKSNDATNQYTDIHWYEIGDLSEVPGSLSNKFIKGSTLQRIHDNSIKVFSKLIYNEKNGDNIYNDIKFDVENDSFFSLLSSEDVEDLLALWLFRKFGYITIPSTSKKTTELYEYVMIDPKTGKKIFTQVKQGSTNIDANNYKNLDSEVWLLTTEGKVQNEGISPEIKVADPNEIKTFALSEDNYNLFSQKIKNWIEYYKSKI